MKCLCLEFSASPISDCFVCHGTGQMATFEDKQEITRLRALNADLLEAVKGAQRLECARHCPTTWYGNGPQPHGIKCVKLTKLIVKASTN